MVGRVPDEPRPVAREVHRQRGIARLRQGPVGHEFAAADYGDDPSVVPEADQHAVITAGDYPAIFDVVGVAWPESDLAGPSGLAQCAVRTDVEAAGGRDPHAGQ